MLKKSMLSLLMIFSVGFSLMGSEKTADQDTRFIRKQIKSNLFFNTRDQYIKLGLLLVPVTITGAAIYKGLFGGGMNANESFTAMAAGCFSSFVAGLTILATNATQEKRNAEITTLREQLKPKTS